VAEAVAVVAAAVAVAAMVALTPMVAVAAMVALTHPMVAVAAMVALTHPMVAGTLDRAVAQVWGGILDPAVARVWGAADGSEFKCAVVVTAMAVVRAAGSRSACAADFGAGLIRNTAREAVIAGAA
jgi:hypothetical protein